MRINDTHNKCGANSMYKLYDRTAPKKATNLSVNSSLLAEAKNLKVNLSATLEKALEQELRETKRKSWLKENKQAINNCNHLTQKHGLFSDKFRAF